MDLFDVYSRYPIQLVKGQGAYVWDQTGQEYLDLYGGHAVISIGHQHPHFVERLKAQLERLVFYSNSVLLPEQKEFAQLLGELSGYPDHSLFLCNSGAEANENALKLASFHTGKAHVVCFERGFHGRTSGTVVLSDNTKLVSRYNAQHPHTRLAWEDLAGLEKTLKLEDVCAVIVEGIQGVGGIHVAGDSFLREAQALCKAHGALLILDEIQSGYGRSGRFFAHQHSGIEADLITMAKGMGNGFPIGGVLIHPDIQPWAGMLGTTFGGNPLACAAGLAVLEVIREEKLMGQAERMGVYCLAELTKIPALRAIRGKGLMIGMEWGAEVGPARKKLLLEHQIFTGISGKHTLRLLPALNIRKEQADAFLAALPQVLPEVLPKNEYT